MDICTIASGSSGNCTYIGTGRTALLVDAGISGKRIEEGLFSIDRRPGELSGILLTHEHIDHIQGLGVMARRYHIPIYGTAGTLEYLLGTAKVGKIDPGLLHFIKADEAFSIGDLTVDPFHICHDAAEPVGYRFSDERRSAAVATDMGCYSDYIVEHLRGVNGLLIETNHDVNMLQVGPYPYPLKQRILGDHGHLSNEVAGSLLCEILHDELELILLGHLSQENNYPPLAMATVCSQIVMDEQPYRPEDFEIAVADRHKPSKLYSI